jgi:uncharacterized protein (TIRG00374 family)
MTASLEPPQQALAQVRYRVGAKDLLGFAVGVGLIVLILRWLAPDWAELRASVTWDWRYAGLGLLGTTLASLVTAARWRLLAEVMGGTKLGYSTYFFSLVSTRVLGQLPFFPMVAVDLIGRGFLLQNAGSKRTLSHAATQVVLERMFDGVLPVVVLVWALAVRGQWLAIDPALSLVLAGLGFLAVAIPLLRPGVRVALRAYLAVRLGVAKLRRRQLEAESEAELGATPRVDAKLATKVAVLSLARYATVVVQFYGIAGAVGLDIGWAEMAAATSVAQLAGLLSVTPGGLGILEAGWAGGLGWIGLGAEPISLFVVVQRLGVIVFFGLLSVASFPLFRRDKRTLAARSNPGLDAARSNPGLDAARSNEAEP